MNDQKPILWTRNGLHRVDFLDTQPMPHACTLCGGECPTPIACHLPEQAAAGEPTRGLLTSRWFWIGGAASIVTWVMLARGCSFIT